MTKSKSKTAIGLLVAVVATAYLPASATGWKVWDGHNEKAPRAILTTTADQAGAVLVCAPNGQMSAILSLEAGDISDQIDKHATYRRGETASITAGDTPGVETVVQYAPANSTIEIGSHSPAAKIYNSVIRGSTQSRTMRSKHSQKPAMPPARRVRTRFLSKSAYRFG